MIRLRPLAIILTALFVLTAAACGGGEKKLSAEDAQPIADRAVLTDEDVPDGFEADEEEEEDPGEEEDESDENNPLEDCLGDTGAELEDAEVAEADSPDYQRESDTGIEMLGSSSAVLDTEEHAKEAAEILDTDEARECFAEAFEEEMAEAEDMPPGLEIETKGVEEHDFASIGDHSSAIRMDLVFNISDAESGMSQELPFVMDMVFIQKGHALVMMFFGSLGEEFDQDEAEEIAEKVIARV